ncbi:hypothetical protein GCM10007972_00230 [Iodidimonas muriae]|uniref:Lipid/polyisoprenoid-binding YceI-like domain-containing protein n=1 Tax=Iodidimonas muriae TaxID=261467 RepID=A0ABQ2L5T6_9PROT|nr:YceI family protein [Iodidimonas muriae]GER06280.1 hypothetical protein JCM17843_05900 [Kordiimonadales bacterium JCM 17843]GGO04126.1 hypothetical protein GCM10007972_00230 [Iodidimonas muriae]
MQSHLPAPCAPVSGVSLPRFALAVAFLAVVLLSACTRIEQGLAVLSHDVSTRIAPIPAGVYHSDPDHVFVHFSLWHLDYSQFTGRFDDVAIALHFDPSAPTQSQLDVDIPVASLNSGSEAIDGMLKTEFFDLKAHPSIRFTANTTTLLDAQTGQIEGILEMNGRTRPLVLEVVFNGYAKNPLTGVPTMGFSAHGELDRSDWGLGKWVPAVGKTVRLQIEAELVLGP